MPLHYTACRRRSSTPSLAKSSSLRVRWTKLRRYPECFGCWLRWPPCAFGILWLAREVTGRLLHTRARTVRVVRCDVFTSFSLCNTKYKYILTRHGGTFQFTVWARLDITSIASDDGLLSLIAPSLLTQYTGGYWDETFCKRAMSQITQELISCSGYRYPWWAAEDRQTSRHDVDKRHGVHAPYWVPHALDDALLRKLVPWTQEVGLQAWNRC